MVASRPWRGLALLVLLGALFGLLVWYGSLEPDPSVWALPGPEELGHDYGRYVGDRVAVSGRVVETDPIVIAAQYDVNNVIRLRLVGLEDSVTVSEGARLNVYGVVEPDHTVRVLNVVQVPARGVWYTYTISFLAGLWVLGRIVRYWEVDLGELALRRRSAPLPVGDWLWAWVNGGNEGA